RIQRKRTACPELTRLARPAFEPPALPLKLSQRHPHRTMRLEEGKDLLHPFRLFLIHHQPPASGIYIIAQHRASAYPFPFPASSGHLVPRALADQFAFELGKREQ